MKNYWRKLVLPLTLVVSGPLVPASALDRPGTPTDISVRVENATTISIRFRNTATRDEDVYFEYETRIDGAAVSAPSDNPVASRHRSGGAWSSPWSGRTVFQLRPQTDYCFRVWARNVATDVRSGQPSAWACARTPRRPPLAPLDVQARVASYDVAKGPVVSWNAPDQSDYRGIQRFVVERQSPPGGTRPWILEATLSGPDGARTVSDASRPAYSRATSSVDARAQHAYRVCAESDGGRTCAESVVLTVATDLFAGRQLTGRTAVAVGGTASGVAGRTAPTTRAPPTVAASPAIVPRPTAIPAPSDSGTVATGGVPAASTAAAATGFKANLPAATATTTQRNAAATTAPPSPAPAAGASSSVSAAPEPIAQAMATPAPAVSGTVAEGGPTAATRAAATAGFKTNLPAATATTAQGNAAAMVGRPSSPCPPNTDGCAGAQSPGSGMSRTDTSAASMSTASVAPSLAARAQGSNLPRNLSTMSDSAIVIVGGVPTNAGELKRHVLGLDDNAIIIVGGRQERASMLKQSLSRPVMSIGTTDTEAQRLGVQRSAPSAAPPSVFGR